MKAHCACEACATWKDWREEQEHLLDILGDKNFLEDMLSNTAQKKEELTKRVINLTGLVQSLRLQNSRSAEDLNVAEAELESLQMHITSMQIELEKHREAKEEAKVVLRRYEAALAQANLALRQQQEQKAKRDAEAKARATVEEKRVHLLRLEVERNSGKLKQDKADAEAAVDQCKKMAQLLESQGLLTKELKEELASIMGFRMEQLRIKVDSDSEMDASNEADPESQRLEELLAADEHKSPEPSVERCLSAIAEMKVPRALSPLPPSPPLARRPPPSVSLVAAVQSAPSTAPLEPALPAGGPPPPVPKPPQQLTSPSEPMQGIPVLDPVLSRQEPEYEPCKAEPSAMEQEPSTRELPQPKKRRLTHSPTQDEQLSDGEVQPPSKKPLLSKRQVHQLFSSGSSGEEDEAKEEKSNEQSPPGAFPPCPSERAVAAGGKVSASLVQGREDTHGAISGRLASRGTLGTHGGVVCSPVHAASSKAPSGNLTRAKKGKNVGTVGSPAPATASKAASGNPSEKDQSLSLYRAFLRSKEHATTSRAAVNRKDTTKMAQAVLGRLAYFATQREVPPEELELCVRKIKCDQLVWGALNYLCECKANPVSAYCRGEQTPPLITKFETLLLQALAHKKDGWVMFLSALRARFWSHAQPKILMGRASYVRLIGALCCKLDERTVAQVLIWDLLGTNQAPFLVASVVGAWPGLLKALPAGVVQKTVAYLLLDSPAHTLNSTLEFQARQVLRTLGPLRGFIKYIPKQLAEQLVAPLLSAHKCGDTCVMHHRAIQELCQRSPESLLPWLLEQQLAPQAESVLGYRSSGCLILLLVSLWKMYKEPPEALQPVFTQLVQRVKSKGLLSKKRLFLKWEGSREVLKRSISGNEEAPTAEPPPQESS